MKSLQRPLKRRLRTIAENTALRLGWRLARLTPKERRYLKPSHTDAGPAPPEAAGTLQRDNPVLKDLRKRYARVDLPVTKRSLWRSALLESDLDLQHFRGDNPYVWQYRHVRSGADLKYYLYLRYLEERDSLGLLQRLSEDGAFGCWTFDYEGRSPVSRDLLDSVNEINFLERRLGISKKPALRVVDVGAGYGRLAHRMCGALPNLAEYYCLDAIPESTFLCDYYMGYRGCADRVSVVPLDKAEAWESPGDIHLGVNIYSFPECPFEVVRWWLQWLAARHVRNLLIVPNDANALLTTERDGSRRDFAPLLEGAGYRLVHQEHIIDDPNVRRFTKIMAQFYMFGL